MSDVDQLLPPPDNRVPAMGDKCFLDTYEKAAVEQYKKLLRS